MGKRDAHLSAHDFQQDTYPTLVIEVFEFSDEVGKRPRRHAHALPFLQVEVESDIAVGTAR